ncbi:MAG: aspartate kinase [Alphaproteobacteria bacterium]
MAKNTKKHNTNIKKTILVKKFGGTSLGNKQRIHATANIIKHFYHTSNDGLCIVVSAMAKETDRLVSLVADILEHDKFFHRTREYDAVVASGENVSAGLLALALNHIGIKAKSWQGFQIPIETDDQHGMARITSINITAIKKSILNGEVAVITGFQGINHQGSITTLGRGGSDTSAVAMAVALGARRCDIYTDVDGVYRIDPKWLMAAKKIPAIAYEEMLEMASLGSGVLHARSVELAMKCKMPLQVLSSFVEPKNPNAKKNGTMVLDEKSITKNMKNNIEEKLITAVAVDNQEAKVTIYKIKNQPGMAAIIFGLLADANINVDMIIQSGSHHERGDEFSDITFTLPRQELAHGVKVLEQNQTAIGYEDILADADVAKISIIGVGMRSSPGVAKTMFATLASADINIEAIATSEIKISVLVKESHAPRAAKLLHKAFHLG